MCSSVGSRTKEKGIVVGSDQRQEWLLPWWWEHYSARNRFPVAFLDFGMSEKGKAWCRKRGALISFAAPVLNEVSSDEVSLEKRAVWERRYGGRIWLTRSIWLQKPMALAQSPFSMGIWIDLDCQVKEPLGPLFDLLGKSADLAASLYEMKDLSDPFPYVIYNAGVIVFRKGAKILEEWIRSTIESPHDLPADEDYLSLAIGRHREKTVDLPLIYNWPRPKGENKRAAIVHFHSAEGKLEI